jgi:hypothetical protein
MFEALEILACLMFPEQKNLNGWLVRDKFKPIALTLYTNCVQVEAIEKNREVTSPQPARFGRARLRAGKRSAPAAVARLMLGARRSAILGRAAARGCVLTKDRTPN